MSTRSDKKSQKVGWGTGLVVHWGLALAVFALPALAMAADYSGLSTATQTVLLKRVDRDSSLNADTTSVHTHALDMRGDISVTDSQTTVVGQVKTVADKQSDAGRSQEVAAASLEGGSVPHKRSVKDPHDSKSGAAQQIDGTSPNRVTDEQPLSYALILVLVAALIGLVPVSRRQV